MVGRPPAVSDQEILRGVYRTLADSTDPAATTAEIAEQVSIKREGLGRRLNDLVERGLVKRKQVGVSYIWWLADDINELVGLLPETEVSGQHDSAASTQSVEERLKALFEVGREHFDLELGAVARVVPAEDLFELEYTSDQYDGFEPGTTLPLSETYCTTVATEEGPASVADPTEAGFDDRFVNAELGLETYLGTLVHPDDGNKRTVFFVSSEPRKTPYSEEDYAFQALFGQCVKQTLECGSPDPVES